MCAWLATASHWLDNDFCATTIGGDIALLPDDDTRQGQNHSIARGVSRNRASSQHADLVEGTLSSAEQHLAAYMPMRLEFRRCATTALDPLSAVSSPDQTWRGAVRVDKVSLLVTRCGCGRSMLQRWPRQRWNPARRPWPATVHGSTASDSGNVAACMGRSVNDGTEEAADTLVAAYGSGGGGIATSTRVPMRGVTRSAPHRTT